MSSNCMYGAAHPGDTVAVRSRIGKTVGWLCPAHYKQHERTLISNGYHFRTPTELEARGELNGGEKAGTAAATGVDSSATKEQRLSKHEYTSWDKEGIESPPERNASDHLSGESYGSQENGRHPHDGRPDAPDHVRPEEKVLETVPAREATGERRLPSETTRPQGPLVPEWPKWCEGAGHLSLTEAQRNILQEPFADEEITIRYDGVVYAPWRRYWSRIIRAFAPIVPSVIPVDNPRFQGAEIVVGVVMVVAGTYIGKAWGSHRLEGENDRMSVGDRIESAISDAIAKIGKRLNMGEDLWDDSFRDYWKSQYAESYSNGRRTYWRRRPFAKVEEHE